MGTFTVRREVAAPASDVWRRMVHWPNHGRWVPLTTGSFTSAATEGVGSSFVGRTGIGRLAFDDPMVVTHWQPPGPNVAGRCDIRKVGRVAIGEASFTVTAVDDERCAIEWTESVDIVGVRRLPLAGAVSTFFGRLAFGQHHEARGITVETVNDAGPGGEHYSKRAGFVRLAVRSR